MNVRSNVMRPFRLDRRAVQRIAHRRKGIIQRIVPGGRIVHDVWFVQELAIDVYLLIHEFQVISRQPNHAFHEMLMVRIGKLEDDDVSVFQGAIRKKFFIPSASAAKDKFVHQQMISHQ